MTIKWTCTPCQIDKHDNCKFEAWNHTEFYMDNCGCEMDNHGVPYEDEIEDDNEDF